MRMKATAVGAVLGVIWAGITANAVYFCSPKNELCMTTTASNQSMQFVITTAITGWVGIGINHC